MTPRCVFEVFGAVARDGRGVGTYVRSGLPSASEEENCLRSKRRRGGRSRPQNQTQGQERRKLSKDELASYDAMNALVNSVMSGKQPAPADVKLTFRNHFLKSDNNLYVPYTVEIEPGKLTTTPRRHVYPSRSVRSRPPMLPLSRKRNRTRAVAMRRTRSKTCTSFPEVPAQLDRAMELPAGDYDVYIAMAERPKDKKAQATAKSVVFTHTLNVPATGTALTTSSVILAKSIEPSAAQLNAQQQLEQPYTISGYKIVPRYTSVIPKAEELVFVFFIYNEGVAASGKAGSRRGLQLLRARARKSRSASLRRRRSTPRRCLVSSTSPRVIKCLSDRGFR